MKRLVLAGIVLALLAVGGPQALAAHRPTRQPAVEPRGVAPTGVGDTGHLEAGLGRAVARAVAAAAADGVDVHVTSGWRSAAEQQQLFKAAVTTHGSVARARQWVLPPAESAHVKGLAVDVGPASGARWLDRNGVHFGLCRRYANESWHFERLAAAVGSRCPDLQAHA